MGVRYEIRRVLYPFTTEQRGEDIPDALQRMGYEALTCEILCRNGSEDRNDIDAFVREIREQEADAVITHDFLLAPAIACAICHVPYLAWIWDAPDMALYHDAAKLPTSFIFDFDRLQAEESRGRGCPHVIHYPLAANTTRVEELVIRPEDERRFACEISFIGALYSGSEYRLPKGLSHEVQGEVDTIIREMTGRWDGKDRMTDRLSDPAVMQIADAMVRNGRLGAGIPLPLIRRSLEMKLLSRRAAFLERTEMLRRLARYDLQFYTVKEDLDVPIPGVESQPPLHYTEETPKAYSMAKINLNLTLHSIRSGVPLRVFDILGAGGFLLSSYQPELEELFRIGEELEVFHSYEELEDKVTYYLQHEEARSRIAVNGYLKVRERYSYEKQLAGMFGMVAQEDRWEGEIRFR